jgi:hypothetical protein
MKKLTKKEIERLIEVTYYKHGHGVQIDIMDIPKIFKIGEKAIADGKDLEEAIKQAIELLRRN